MYQAPNVARTAMMKIFNPMAVNPPSAKTSACTIRTTVTASTPAHGPIKIAAKAPPIKCPLVPAATGKLIICIAKINTAANPASGATFSSN